MTRTRRWTALVVAVAALALAGCQAKVVVGVEVRSDASGVVTVSIQLDGDAAAKAGDLDEALRLDDLRAAGWTTTPSSAGPDGATTIAVSKPFADPAGFTAVMDELNPTVFRDFVLTRDSDLFGTTFAVTGTIDLTGGLRSFSDADLDAVEGDPVGSEIAAIEQREGVPATEMVDISMAISLPGKADAITYSPKFSDPAPTVVDASSKQGSALSSLTFWILAVLVLVTVAVVLRSAFRRFRG